MSESLAKDELMVAIYRAWHIWKERGMRVFQNTSSSKRQFTEMIKDDLADSARHIFAGEISGERVRLAA
jgi:hypothetical protein